MAAQTVLGTPYACTAIPNDTWVNIQFPTQTANFELQFDASSSVASNGNMVLDLGQAASTSYTTTAINSRFYTNVFQAENNSTYEAVSPFSYSANTLYHLTYDINMANKTYNLYIGLGTARTTIATNYAFRPAGASASLSYLTSYQSATSATGQICNVVVLTYPESSSVNLTWNAATVPTGAPPVNGYNVYESTNGSSYSEIATEIVNTNYVDTTVTSNVEYYYKVTATNSVGESAPSNVASILVP